MKQPNSTQRLLEASWKAMAELNVELAAESQLAYPEGWGTSPRRAPIPAKAYKPAHGGYPDAKQAR